MTKDICGACCVQDRNTTAPTDPQRVYVVAEVNFPGGGSDGAYDLICEEEGMDVDTWLGKLRECIVDRQGSLNVDGCELKVWLQTFPPEPKAIINDYRELSREGAYRLYEVDVRCGCRPWRALPHRFHLKAHFGDEVTVDPALPYGAPTEHCHLLSTLIEEAFRDALKGVPK